MKGWPLAADLVCVLLELVLMQLQLVEMSRVVQADLAISQSRDLRTTELLQTPLNMLTLRQPLHVHIDGASHHIGASAAMSPTMCPHLVPPAQTWVHIHQWSCHADTKEYGASAVSGALVRRPSMLHHQPGQSGPAITCHRGTPARPGCSRGCSRPALRRRWPTGAACPPPGSPPPGSTCARVAMKSGERRLGSSKLCTENAVCMLKSSKPCSENAVCMLKSNGVWQVPPQLHQDTVAMAGRRQRRVPSQLHL
jgi:hypothetical protein